MNVRPVLIYGVLEEDLTVVKRMREGFLAIPNDTHFPVGEVFEVGNCETADNMVSAGINCLEAGRDWITDLDILVECTIPKGARVAYTPDSGWIKTNKIINTGKIL